MRIDFKHFRHQKNIITAVLVLLLGAMLTACGGGGGGPASPITPPPVQSEVSNEVIRGSVTAAGGAVLTVPPDASGLAGATVEIPPDAALEDIEVQIGFQDAAPGNFSAQAVAADATPVSKTIMLKVANSGPSTFNLPITITIPYDVAATGGLPPAILYWDPDLNSYNPVSVISVDTVKGTVTFQTSHFSTFVAVIAKGLDQSDLGVDTGFRLGVNSILHPNFGSYEYGGHCAAFASMATHYFGLAKAKALYAFAQEGADEQPVDDELTRTALSMTYALLSSKWKSVAPSLVIPSATNTGLLMIQSMRLTGKPVHLVMHSGNKKDGGHSVTAFAYDSANARFRIYDSNFPKNEVTLDWNPQTGFGAYSRADVYPAAMFNYIGFATDDTFGAPSQFDKIISDWESGKLKDYFSNLEITDENGVIQPLAYGSQVKLMIAYQDNQTISGKFNRPTGSTKPVYLHVYYNGVKQSAAAAAIDPSGKFTLNFPTKLDMKTDVMLLVSEHPRDTYDGFSAFGKFSVQPDGKNFFVNFGFESGDLTGWSGQTTLLSSGGVWTPTKLEVVGIGFDPIATDIPTAVFGGFAAQVNDQTPDYHTTFVSQKAIVPASGNPQLLFSWAAVLEDPQHAPIEQPYVDVLLTNVTKGIELYHKRFYTSDPSFNGWTDYQGGAWKAIPWQSVVIAGLSQYAGDEIELRVDGADCTLGGHGGYVYLDGEE